MIYLDSSVVLAQLLSEDRVPERSLWGQTLVTSRLLEYEVWNRINAKDLGESHGTLVRDLLGRVAMLELSRPVLQRALEPFPSQVRTVDAIHLASMDFLRSSGQELLLASYDVRLVTAASRLGFASAQL